MIAVRDFSIGYKSGISCLLLSVMCGRSIVESSVSYLSKALLLSRRHVNKGVWRFCTCFCVLLCAESEYSPPP